MDKQNDTHTSAAISWQAALTAERSRIATKVLPILIGAGVAFGVFFVGLYFVLDRPWQWVWMIFEIVQAPVLLTIAYVLARRGNLTATVHLTALSINVTAVIGPALVEGMVIPGVMAAIIATIFGRLLAGRGANRAVVAISGVALVTGIVLSGAEVFEILPLPAWIQVVVAISAVLLVGLLITQVLGTLDQRYETSLVQAETYANELSLNQAALEERTGELARRARYLEATAAIAQEAASVLDAQQLLTRVASLISEQFGFYHTGVFLLDATAEWAVLQAASSAGGQRMLARGHRLKVGQVGIVGYVTGVGEPRVALDVGEDAVFFDNPDLPETRSEMALPLRARGQIIGALDVQSREREAFSDEDVAVLQTLADQVATAISNAQLFEQAQESLEAQRRAYGQMSRETWTQTLRARPGLGYRYDQGNVASLAHHSEPRSDQRGAATTALPELALPLSVRGQTVGTIRAHKSGEAGEWTSEETALMETLVDQLGQALESARLYQDTQRRAARERLTAEVTARMRETLDLEAVLRSAAVEIGEALGLAALDVRLGTGAEGTGN